MLSPYFFSNPLDQINKLQSLPPVAKKSPFYENVQEFIYPL